MALSFISATRRRRSIRFSALISLRHKDRKHLIAFHARPDLGITDVGEILFELFEDSRAQLAVGHLAPAKPDRGFNFIAARQPLARMLHAIAVIVGVGAGTKLNLLDSDDDLLLFRFVCLLLRFVLKLSEVDDLANRRLGIRRDFNQIHAFLARSANCFASLHHAELLAIVTDDAHLRHANAFVNSSNRRASEIWTTTASVTCSYCCTSWVNVSSFEFEVSSWPGDRTRNAKLETRNLLIHQRSRFNQPLRHLLEFIQRHPAEVAFGSLAHGYLSLFHLSVAEHQHERNFL